jgi:hypothetical protein
MKIRSTLDEICAFWNDAIFEFGHWAKREQPCILNGLVVGNILERLDED